jgi:hypothetical protein
MMWLTDYQQPSYHTIADFRSAEPHRKALKNVFRHLVQFCRQADLIGGEVVAVDGSKFRAQNAMKNNFNLDKIERQIEYHERRFEEYISELEQGDTLENTDDERADFLLEKAQTALERLEKHQKLKEILEKSGQTQISLTDPDARAVPMGKGLVEVGYNVQFAVDQRHKLLLHHQTTHEKDTHQLAPIALECQQILQTEGFIALADKGYCQGKTLDACHQNDIETCVAPLEYAPAADPQKFRKEDFLYDEKQDVYRCPNGEILNSNQSIYTRKSPKTGEIQYTFKRYNLPNRTCQNCPLKQKCLTNNELHYRHKRHIDRNEYDHAIERNAAFVAQNKELYRLRQTIVEHPFGTIKRSWGYTYTLLKGLDKVDGEFAIISTVYNLRRLVSILHVKSLLERLKSLFFAFFDLFRGSVRCFLGLAGRFFAICPVLPNLRA